MGEQTGLILAIALYVRADEAGNFSNAVAFTSSDNQPPVATALRVSG